MKIAVAETIVAPATNLAKQAISIIRMSGQDSFKILNQLLNESLPSKAGTYLRNIYTNKAKQLLDQVFIIAFAAPKSFTGEDVIEINCHGGILITKKIIQELIYCGARMAERGEFSKRAFLNEKISLIQAQGINDLIEAKNELTLYASANNVTGVTNKAVLTIKEKILDIISEVQTALDYPEYEETSSTTNESIKASVDSVLQALNQAINVSKRISSNKNGIKTAIIGVPNVGKSSLLNALLQEDKALVSDEIGTTRDVVEGELNFKHFNLLLMDTAGIRETTNKVEKAGIEKSLKVLSGADLILHIISPTEELKLLPLDQNRLYVINKIDQLSKKELIDLKKRNAKLNPVYISALTGDVEDLIKRIEQKYELNEIIEENTIVLTNLNEIAQLEKVQSHVKKAASNISEQQPIDLINIDLRNAFETINELMGLHDIDEEIINNIFLKYCLGK